MGSFSPNVQSVFDVVFQEVNIGVCKAYLFWTLDISFLV